MSKSNALGSSYFTPFQEGPTWEDWRVLVREKHPIRFFLYEIIKRASFRAYWCSRKWYAVQSWFRKDHYVDLRGIDKTRPYEYGYNDPCEQVRLVCWKALMDYVEHIAYDPDTAEFTSEDREQEWYKDKKDLYEEVQGLYHYWTVEMPHREVQDNVLDKKRKEAVAAADESAYDAYMKEMIALHRARNAEDQKNLERVVALSPYFWA